MSKTTFLGYVPSLKSKHEATIVGGKAIESKGGSIRYMLQGEYDGRKTLPKTVSKADFESVYGFDAKEAEAVYIKGIQDFGGVKRDGYAKYHQVGREDVEGFEPKEIIPIENKDEALPVISEEMDKEPAFVLTEIPHSEFKKLGFRADTVGNPSPASVEPPAPSEKPFPQEPSNENFSADNEAYYQEWLEHRDAYEKYDAAYIMDMIKELVIHDRSEKEWLESYGYEDWSEVNLSKKDAINAIVALKMKPEVKEAFGFGKDEEEEKEESDEPKTQEFTVVMQPGDKLELTDIEEDEGEETDEETDESTEEEEPKEENNDETDENEEKEAEHPKTRTFVVSSVDYDTGQIDDLDLPQDFIFSLDIDEIGDANDKQEIADLLVDNISDETGWVVEGFYFQEKMPDGTLVHLDGENYEAVETKITRPVKEEKEEDEEDDEGSVDLGTIAKVGAVGLGALVLGNLVLGAEGKYICPHCSVDLEEDGLDFTEVFTCPACAGVIYDSGVIGGGHHPADFMGNWKAEEPFAFNADTDYSDIYGAEGEGSIDVSPYDEIREVPVHFRHDYASKDYEWKGEKYQLSGGKDDGMTISEDLDEGETDEVIEMVEQIVTESDEDEGYETFDDSQGIRGHVDWDTYKDEGRFYGLAAEGEDVQKMTSSEFVPFDQITAEIQEEWDETTPSIAADYQPSNEPSNANFSAEDYQSLKDEYERHWGEIDDDQAKGLIRCKGCDEVTSYYDEMNYCEACQERKKEGLIDDEGNWTDDPSHPLYELKPKYAETVGTPSPSGPSSTPEPAEATGSEPSNEHMESESKNMKLALGVTVVGIGIAAFIGKDRLGKLLDWFEK